MPTLMPTQSRTSLTHRPSSPLFARCGKLLLLAVPALLVSACQIQTYENNYSADRPTERARGDRRPWSDTELAVLPPVFYIRGGQSVPDLLLPTFVWIPRGGSATINAWWNPSNSPYPVDVQVDQPSSVPAGSLTVSPTDFQPKTQLLGAPITVKASGACPDAFFTLYLTDGTQKSGSCIVQVSKDKPKVIKKPFSKVTSTGGQSVPDQFAPVDLSNPANPAPPTKLGGLLTYQWQLVDALNPSGPAKPETFTFSVYALEQLPNSSDSIVTLVAAQQIICPKKASYTISIPINPSLPITNQAKIQAILTSSNGDHYLAEYATITK